MEGLKSRAVALIVCLVLILVGWFGGSAIQAMNGGALITAKASGLKADTVVMQVGDADVTAGEYLYWLASVCDGFYQYYGISDWSMSMTAACSSDSVMPCSFASNSTAAYCVACLLYTSRCV